WLEVTDGLSTNGPLAPFTLRYRTARGFDTSARTGRWDEGFDQAPGSVEGRAASIPQPGRSDGTRASDKFSSNVRPLAPFTLRYRRARGFDTSARTERWDEGFDKLSPNERPLAPFTLRYRRARGFDTSAR